MGEQTRQWSCYEENERRVNSESVMEKVLREERGLTEKVTCEQSPKGGGSFGDTGEMLQAEGTVRAKALREEGQEAASSS